MKLKEMCLLLVAVFMFSSFALAQENAAERMAHKAWVGGVNLLTGVLEVPYQIVKGTKRGFAGTENAFIGGIAGFFRGIVHAIGRSAAGAIDLVGFWLPNPPDNEGVGIPLDAKYVWEEGEAYSVFDEGLEPVGRKLLRGLGNSAGATLEFPGQLVKGFKNNDPVMGILKSLWYPAGRLYGGVADVATCLIPTATEQYGEPFTEEYPWDAIAGKYDTAE